jgi:hypothetical protein
MFAWNERTTHPRLPMPSRPLLKDARACLEAAPHDFGGHKAKAIRASDETIKQLNLALQYRAIH